MIDGVKIQLIDQLTKVTEKNVLGVFQHDGFFHLVAGTLFLGFIGPIVEAAFGSLGFLGIYILGGAFGNLLSFIQTQEITVGGTVSGQEKRVFLRFVFQNPRFFIFQFLV